MLVELFGGLICWEAYPRGEACSRYKKMFSKKMMQNSQFASLKRQEYSQVLNKQWILIIKGLEKIPIVYNRGSQ